MEQLGGPRLSDARFFGELIDTALPGLEAIPTLVQAQNYAACRRLFASYVRSALDEEKFFSVPYEFPENKFMLPGETEAEAARRIERLRLISCGTPHQFEGKVDWFCNPTYNQYEEWTWQLSRHHEWKLLAHQYRLTGDETHAKVFAGLFESWVRQAAAPDEETPSGATLCWRTIECGIRMGASWPYTLFAFYKSLHFTDDLLTDWYKSVWEHGRRLRTRHWKNNWLIMEMNGLGQIGILYPVFKESGEWLQYAADTLNAELDRQVYPAPDDFQVELSTNYHYVAVNNYLRLMRVAQAYEVPLPAAFTGRLEKMLEFYIKIMRPDGYCPDINDGTNGAIVRYLKPHQHLFGGNRLFQWLLNGRRGEGPAYTSAALEYAGMMVMRDGWGENDTWGFLDAAPFGTAHQHEDKLNFLLHAKGKYILTECGNYAYDGSEMRKYALSTRSHNTVRVNGMDQNRRKNYCWEEEDVQKKAGMLYRMEEHFDYAAGVYDEGYGEAEYRGAVHRRSVLFLKKPEGMEPFFVVTDRLISRDQNEYEILWHTDAQEVKVRGMQAQADFLHFLCSLNADRGHEVGVVSAQKEPEYQGWQCPTKQQRADLPLPTVRYIARGNTLRVVTVLYPDENCPIVQVTASECAEDTSIHLQMRDGNEMLLDERDFAPADFDCAEL
ncbi:MAG: hypothetical protein E7329_06160 [Clostridiales bacterium]|nr:hypothetical protein [Clostridiales bacterium]